MLKLIKIILVIALLVLGFSLLSDRFSNLYAFNEWHIKAQHTLIPLFDAVQVLLDRNPLTISTILTYAVVLIGFLYLILHFIEFIAKSISRLFNREHEPHKAKQKVGSFFVYMVWTKLILIGLQVVLLVTQAWSMSRFFNYLIEKPKDFFEIISNDVIFIIVLIVLLVLRLIGSQTNPEREVFHST